MSDRYSSGGGQTAETRQQHFWAVSPVWAPPPRTRAHRHAYQHPVEGLHQQQLLAQQVSDVQGSFNATVVAVLQCGQNPDSSGPMGGKYFPVCQQRRHSQLVHQAHQQRHSGQLRGRQVADHLAPGQLRLGRTGCVRDGFGPGGGARDRGLQGRAGLRPRDQWRHGGPVQVVAVQPLTYSWAAISSATARIPAAFGCSGAGRPGSGTTYLAGVVVHGSADHAW